MLQEILEHDLPANKKNISHKKQMENDGIMKHFKRHYAIPNSS